MLKINIVLWLTICSGSLFAQFAPDTSGKAPGIYNFKEISITGIRNIKGMGHLKDEGNCVIYAGKKTEGLLLDSVDANTAQSNPRQLLGRLPGAVFSETQGSGFPSNGIGFRGLDPTQSIETNTRQNGYNISADIFGYNESYFIPPFEAVQRIEVIRGASSLQFGPQFGGVINYIIKQAPDKPFGFEAEATVGSFGFVNLFTALGGTVKKFSYYGYFQFGTAQGWRPNSDYRQYNGFARIQYKPIDKITIGLEYTAMQNRIHMPGGLDDAQFAADPRASYRARNWLTSPWNIAALTFDYNINSHVDLSVRAAYMHSARNLVWRNEDGGPQTLDTISPATNQYDNREVEREQFDNFTIEARVAVKYNIRKTHNTLAAGVRFYDGLLGRQEGGLGTTASDFDLTLVDPMWEDNLRFTTINVAPFVENIFRVTPRFSITPGFRFEFIRSTAEGYTSDENGDELDAAGAKNRFIPLAGIGLQVNTTYTTQLYANCSQAYRPIDFAQLSPFGSTSRIDPNMKDASGFNVDLGWRGKVKSYFIYDLSAFYLQYNNRVGLVQKTDDNGNLYTLRTNVANSAHIGAETYIEVFPMRFIPGSEKYGQFSFYNSFSYIHARYTSGEFKGNYVENAPAFIERLGITYAIADFSTTFNYSYTTKSYSDAGNTVYSEDATVGLIPAYGVFDLSAAFKFLKHYHLKAGVNNLGGANYFTKRTDEYPGPGIIPAIGRSFYVGLGANF
ncbi:MAG TPA: TonB-dependent receptor [Chitinophagales bacterium]|nr:TonB-dependent receptor [Chitinophagales bacterium]